MPRGTAPMRRSEPNVSARNPRMSSAVEKRVYCGGAPWNEPGGAGCLPEAARAAADNEIMKMHAANDRFIFKLRCAPLAHQAFLRHRGDQRAVAGENKSAREAARAVQIRRVLRVEQPLVGAERSMQPERMIEAGGHEFLLEQRAPVRHPVSYTHLRAHET